MTSGNATGFAIIMLLTGIGIPILAALNGGRHVAPSFAGDTIFAWSEVLDKAEIPGRTDVGALRLRTVGVKNQPATDFPDKGEDGKDHAAVVLDLDYWALMPRG